MNNFGWPPDKWLGLSRREKAMVIAGIDLRVEEEAKQEKKAKAEAKRKH
jgi:hypothetical protein